MILYEPWVAIRMFCFLNPNGAVAIAYSVESNIQYVRGRGIEGVNTSTK